MKGDKVWLRTHQTKKGENPKLAPKYQGPYEIVDVLPYHTYRVMKNRKTSVQHESRIRLHVANDGPAEETVDSNDEEMIEDKDTTLSLGNLLNIHAKWGPH